MAPIPHTSRGADLTTGTHDGARLNAEFDRLYADAASLLTQIENALGLATKTDSEVIAARKGQPDLLAEIDRLEAIKAEVEAARNSANQGGGYATLDARLEAIDSRITNALSAAQGAAEVVEARKDAAEKVHAALRDAINKGSKDLEGLSLAAINRIVVSSANIVDAIIYDTSRDSDGGAWRERCAHLSWYNEPLNTATRGKTRKFPAFVAILATTTEVRIHDLTDPDTPMWMVFNIGSSNILYTGSTPSSLAAQNGVLYVGTAAGVKEIHFPADRAFTYNNIGKYVNIGNISQRNGLPSISTPLVGTGIVSSTVNDVAATVLPGAPIDPATGLPVPTVAVATGSANSGGAGSVIMNDGAVIDYNQGGNHGTSVDFTHDGRLVWGLSATSSVAVIPLQSSDVGTLTSHGSVMLYSNSGIPHSGSNVGKKASRAGRGLAWNANLAPSGTAINALAVLLENPAEPTKGMISYVNKDFFSGILPGDIRRAWLANSPTADRSVKNKPLTMVGALTAASVATGADLLGYSGFSASNYVEEPYSADLDFGTGDFGIFGWANTVATTNSRFFFHRRKTDGTGAEIALLLNAGDKIRFGISDGTNTAQADSAAAGDDGTPKFVFAIKRGTSIELWINGIKDSTVSAATVGSLNSSTAVTRLGIGATGLYPADNTTLALWRATAFAPSPEQIRAIYEYERSLFVENAKCLLGGSSNSVKVIDYDPDTGILLVGTANGVSLFQGLRRTDYLAASPLTNTNMKAVSGANGAILMTGGEEAVFQAPQRNIREEVERVKRRFVSQLPRTDWLTADGSKTEFDLPTRAARILTVSQNGAIAREVSGAGASKYTVKDYGYKQAILFGTAPAAGDVGISYVEEL